MTEKLPSPLMTHAWDLRDIIEDELRRMQGGGGKLSKETIEQIAKAIVDRAVLATR